MKQINIKQTTPLYLEWLRRLDFYHFELFILQEQTDEIAETNSDAGILEKAKYFKARIIIRKSHIDKLRNQIRENLNRLTLEIADQDAVERNSKIFAILNQEYLAQHQSVTELRKEFNLFNTEWIIR